MELKNKTLDECFNTYETIQVEHLKVMQLQKTPDLALMTKERENAFLNLKNHLESTLNHSGSSADPSRKLTVLNTYKDRLDSIMKLDEEIADEIKRYKEMLKAGMHRIKNGKKAVNAYRVGGLVRSSPAPSVLSMNR